MSVPRMTRAHFQAIADILADTPMEDETHRLLVRRFGDMCSSSNGMFDRGRFEQAARQKDWARAFEEAAHKA